MYFNTFFYHPNAGDKSSNFLHRYNFKRVTRTMRYSMFAKIALLPMQKLFETVKNKKIINVN